MVWAGVIGTKFSLSLREGREGEGREGFLE